MVSQNKAQLSLLSSKRTNLVRVAAKEIEQKIQTNTYNIDVKVTPVRQLQGSILKLRDKGKDNDPTHQLIMPNSQINQGDS